MLNSKAIDIIKTFSAEEFRRFLSFVKSPYFNNTKSIIRFSDALIKYYPEFSSEKFTEKSMYEKVYGKGKYSYSVMKNLMSELILICDKFLIHDRLSKELVLSKGNSIDLLQEYRQRKLDKLFDLRIKKFEKQLNNNSIENSDVFILSHKLEILKYQYHLHRHSHSKLIWQGFLNKATYELCSIFQMMHITTDTLLHSAEVFKGNADDSLMVKFVKGLNVDEFLKSFDQKKSKEYFFVNLYCKLILLSLYYKKDISEKYYFEIKDSFIKNLKYFPNLDIYDILKSLRSFCISRMKLFRPAFINEMYEIDKLLLEKVDFSSVSISYYIGEIFTEMVVLSAYQKKYKYAEEFILKYKNKINKEIREFETGLNLAFLHLEYNNIEKAIELLSKIKPVNTFMKITIRNLYLRAYYDMEFFEEAFSILDSYRHFVNMEEKFTAERKYFYNLQHSMYLRLFRIKQEPGKYTGFDVSKLREDINKFYFLSEKDWLLKKFTELDKMVGKNR